GPTSVLTFLTTDQGNISPTYTLFGNPAFVNAVGVYVDNANHLWVADLEGNAIYKFESTSAIGNTPPVVTIAGSNTGFNLPGGIAIDKAGQIYIANKGNNTIAIFSQIYQQPGTYNVAPTATISGANTQLSSPLGITFDANNRLYVANTSENHLGHPSVSIYAPSATGNATPTVLLTAGLVDPAAVALDVNDNLWVTDYAYESTLTSKILKYSGPVNAVEPASCTLQGTTIVGPVGLVVNNDYIWTVLDTDPGAIQKFDNPANCNGTLDVNPVDVIFGPNTTLSRSVLMAIYTG
ncbi:NHL repeat-containing protein, partial [bacterium]|nr:NHL repeat-containing protein [bacterium]